MRGFRGLVVIFAVSAAAAGCPKYGWTAPVNTYFTNETNPTSGLRGWHINRASTDRIRHGISLDLDGAPVWDTCAVGGAIPDLILAYSHVTRSNQLLLSADTGQVEIGSRVGHPNTHSQVNITGGTPEAPLDALGVGCFGSRSGLYLYQKLQGSRRTKVNFANLYQIGTDSRMDGTPDFFIGNNTTGRGALIISPTDIVTISHGAAVGGDFRHTGAAIGFFGARPTGRPEVTNSRKDGSALADLLTELSTLGLIVDKTNP